MLSVPVRLGGGRAYRVEIGAGVLSRLGEVARARLPRGTHKVALISNRRVYGLYGGRALSSLSAADFEVVHWLMGEGERFKTLRTAERALGFLSEAGLERGDAVVALGGGVVGDLAGFAAAVYLRGVALVDTATLGTLPRRELTAGWCEALKQGAVGDLRLFERTRKFLAGTGAARAGGDARERELVGIIAAQCAFKARIVAGDEREDVGREDALSRRILNFGHTVGHALEALTDYRRFRHGEAVGYGMLAAAEISHRLGMLDASELESLCEAVALAGRLPEAADLDAETIRRAVRKDKKAVGGRVRWVLLERLGRARVVEEGEIPARVVHASIRAALGAGRTLPNVSRRDAK